MTMTNTAESIGGRPLSAAMFRKPQAASALSLPGVKKLSQRLPAAVASAMTAIGDLPPRVAVEDIMEETGTAMLELTAAATQDYDTGALSLSVSSDQAMALAITDLAFGGTGDEPPFSSSERPLSATESGLAMLLLDRLAVSLHPIVAASFGLMAASADRPPKAEAPSGEEARPQVVFRLLVNVLGYDGEVKIGLNREQLLHLVASGGGDGTRAPAAGQGADTVSGGVAKADTELLVTLADETLTVEALLALAPGQLVPLRSTVHAAVQVWSAGVHLFPARLMRTGNHLAVRIGE